MDKAIASLRHAFDYYVAVGDVAHAVAVGQSTPRGRLGQRIGVAELVTRALALVPPDSREAGYLLSHYGEVLARTEGDYDGAQEAFGRALAIAQREEDIALQMRVLAQWAIADSTHLRYRECLEKCLKVIELARTADEPYAEFAAHRYAWNALGWMGDLDGLRRHAVAQLALAERLRERSLLGLAFLSNANTCRLEGNWQAARAFSDRALAVGPREPRPLSTRVQVEYQAGEFNQGGLYLEQLQEVMRQSPPGPTYEYASPAAVIPLVARITGEFDRLDIAQAAADTVLSSPSATPLASSVARTGLALLAVLHSDVAAAQESYTALEPRRGMLLAPIFSMSADRLLGLLSTTLGRPEQAMAHFEDALTFCRKAGYRPELAWTCYDYADILLNPIGAHFIAPQGVMNHAPTLAGPIDRQKAISLLEEALAISSELGMRPLMEKVVALKEKVESIGATHRLAPTYPDGLTQREVEVLRLVATGKRDREIAEALFISVTTVSTHVRNILNKTNVANRTEATAYAVQHGLI
jgi:DNA-binding CsgD family transcriptional regulator/tetratricopeptide (TPR) repeat protein